MGVRSRAVLGWLEGRTGAGVRSLGAALVFLGASIACTPVGPVAGPSIPMAPPPAAPSTPPTSAAAPGVSELAVVAEAPVPAAAPTPTPSPGPVLPTGVRALWVVRTALVHPDSIRAVVARAEAAGFNTLLVQVRGRGDAWYASGLEPRAIQLERMPPAFDPLALILEEARGRGLRVHAWVNLQLIASPFLPPVDESHLFHAHPEWLAYPEPLARQALGRDARDPVLREALMAWTREHSEQVEGIYASPVHPEARAHTVRVLEDLVARYPVDGIHLDYVRLPSPAFDYGPATLRAFALSLGERAMTPDALLELPRRHPEAWRAFRVGALDALVTEISGALRARRSDLLLSAAVFSDPVDARSGRFQGWTDWLATGLLDVAVPMVYVTDPVVFERRLEAAVQILGPERIWAGLGIYRQSFAEAVQQARQTQARGTGGMVLFSYDWAIGPEGERAAGAGSGGFLRRWANEVWDQP